jgi:hypothetical protein
VLDMEFLTQLLNILIFERCPIVRDDGLGNTIVENKVVQDEHVNLFSCDVGHKDCLNPLTEIFSGCDNELVSIR